MKLMKFIAKIFKHGNQYKKELQDNICCPECKSTKLKIGRLDEYNCENCGCGFFVEKSNEITMRIDSYDPIEIPTDRPIPGAPPPKVYFDD